MNIVLDANVVAPLIKRTLLECLASAGLFSAYVSPKILEEAEYTLKRLPEDSAEHGAHDLKRWRKHGPVQIVSPTAIDLPSLKDPDDAHVLALAITCGATIIVTENIRDFPNNVLAPLGVEAQTADHFVYSLFCQTPETISSILLALAEKEELEFLSPQSLRPTLKRAGFRRVVKVLDESA